MSSAWHVAMRRLPTWEAMALGISISPRTLSGRPVRKASHIVGYCWATSGSASVTALYDPGVTCGVHMSSSEAQARR